MSLLHKYRKEKLLENRLSRLERVIVERSIGKNSEPSKAYRIWDYLMNNGPTSVADLKRVLPDDITRAINFFAKNDLLVKNGDIVSANADYAWDDVGVIPRTAEQEVLNDIGNKLNSTNTDSSDSPTPTRRRTVKANLFSRKIEEVKAAIDAGQDVNQINDKGQTPLFYACSATKTDTGPIVELLLENGANPAIARNSDQRQTCISLAIKNKNISVIKALALGGVALYGIYKDTLCYLCVLTHYLDEATFSKVLDKHFSSSTRLYMYILHNIITAAFRKYGTIVVAKILNICFSNVGKGYSLDQFIPNLPTIGTYIIPDELCEEILNICIKNGCVPNCKGVGNDYDLWGKNKYISKMLFDTVNDVCSGKLKLYDGSSEYFNIIDFISNKYGWTIDNIADILTQSVIDGQSARWGWRYINRAKESDKIKLLRKFKFKRLPQSDFSTYILPLLKNTNNKELIRALFKQTRSYIVGDIDYYLSNGLASYITGIKNKYFFECLLDLDDSGYIGNKLAHFCSRSAYSTNAQVCIYALAEAGYDLNKSEIDYNKVKNNNLLINDIIDHIIDDTMSTNIRRTIEADPSILANSRIQDALNKADDDNTTARQLRTMYDRWVATAEKDKYDM